MKEYIEKVLHQDIKLIPFEAGSRLPLTLRRTYNLYRLTIHGQAATLAEPVEGLPLTQLRKHHKQLEMITGTACVLYLRDINYYAREKMIEEGIPFVWEGHQIYIPFWGVLLDSNNSRSIPPCEQISFLTQKMLITAIYQGWQKVTVTKAAGMLGVTKTSVSRCFDELEALNTPYLKIRSRARQLSMPENKREAWQELEPILRNPVVAVYRLKTCPKDVEILAGTSALACYSMLGETESLFYAVSKSEIGKLNLSRDMMVTVAEEPACVLYEIGYYIEFAEGKAMDPLSIALSLSDEEKEDPRVSMAVDEMLEKYVW